MHTNGQWMIKFKHPTHVDSIHTVGPHAFWYSIYLSCTKFYHRGPRLRPKPSQSQPSLTALARPADFESRSRRKPGQSRGFQAKPGRNITISEIPSIKTEKLETPMDSESSR